MALNTWAKNNLGPDADISRMPGSGGGGSSASIVTIPVTNIMPNGKTMHHFYYWEYFESNDTYELECISQSSGEHITVVVADGAVIYADAGESTDVDYLRVSSIEVTGDLEIGDNNIVYINGGNGTITLTWVVA